VRRGSAIEWEGGVGVDVWILGVRLGFREERREKGGNRERYMIWWVLLLAESCAAWAMWVSVSRSIA